LTDKQSSGQLWQRISIGLGVGLIFTVGALVGEHVSSYFGGNSLDSVMPASKGAAQGRIPASVMSSNTIADVVAAVAPSVVNIELETLNPPPNSHQGAFSFFGGPEVTTRADNSHSQLGKVLGTGIIMSADGYVLTSAHVVRRGSSITVTLADKQHLPAELIGRDRFSDLAVIRVKAQNLKVPKFGEPSSLRPGDWAIAIGSPLGFEHSVSLGIISALNRSINDPAFHSRIDLIQTDVALNPGSSGGPLMNINGEIVGVNSAIRADAQGIGFSIPVDEARKVAKQLIEHGEIPRPYLGVYMQDINPYLAQMFKLKPTVKGVLVAQIVTKGPFEKAGLAAGDVLQKVEGKPVETAEDVRKIVRNKKPGDTLDVVYLRKDTVQNRKIEIGQYQTD
jgi:serine protease Do